MPIISVFFGIAIRIYHSDHNPPHFHASYGDLEAIIEIKTGKILDGRLPKKALQLVEEWRQKNLQELNTAWNTAQLLKTPKRIKGLE